MDKTKRFCTPEEIEHARKLGISWLGLLGRSDLVGQEVQATVNGRSMMAEEFPLKCEDEAAPTFAGLSALPPDDPRREMFVGLLNDKLAVYIAGSAPEA